MTMRKLSCIGIAGTAALLAAAPAQAQDRYLGQVVPFANSFCPVNTIEANGQLLSVKANAALFSLFGARFGGDGNNNFALPDLRGRAPVSAGQGPGLPNYTIAEGGGRESAQLTINELPSHSHDGAMVGYNGAPETESVINAVVADFPDGTPIYTKADSPKVQMAPYTVEMLDTGSNAPVPLTSPYVTIRYCVVTSGIFPPRP